MALATNHGPVIQPPRVYPHLKRAADFIVALAGLIAASPFLLIIMAAIWKESGRPFLFTQPRSGLGGRVFTVYKFRTMWDRPEERHVVADIDTDADDRVTRVGSFLRNTALDELPVLFNILKGDMSFVGPKALFPRVEWPGSPEHGTAIEDVPGFALRSQVRPGLTGLAQVVAAKNITYEEKFRYDARYVSRMSMWADIKLFALSWWISFHGKWESRAEKI